MVHIVVSPLELQTPSVPWVLFLASPLGSLCLVQWLAKSVCIYQALREPLRRQLYQAPISKHLLETKIMTVFFNCIWHGSPCGAVSGWSFLQSVLHTLSVSLCLFIGELSQLILKDTKER